MVHYSMPALSAMPAPAAPEDQYLPISGDEPPLDTPRPMTTPKGMHDAHPLPRFLRPRAARPLVLIADDERSIAELLADILDGAGYDVLLAPNGEIALHLARERHPALILTDLMMPRLDGADLVRSLHARAATRHIPVVLMSSTRPRSATLGNIPFLPKPFDLDEVIEIVRRYARAPHRAPAEA